ncbi:hypothetical protein FQA39_LY03851 [Lamprigera yunnana]|nr:hypothetical protein FQA39_LY03851 [Lamprigera yunnana]
MNPTWTEEEKEQLYQALLKHGPDETELLTNMIPTKSKIEVECAIEAYKTAATHDFVLAFDYEAEETSLPIDDWLRFFKKCATDLNALADIKTALKILVLLEGEYENHHINIKLTQCYKFIIDLMDGNTPKELNEESMCFVMLCMEKLQELTKSENITKELEFIDKLKVPRKTYGKNSLYSYNVNLLNISPELLKINSLPMENLFGIKK